MGARKKFILSAKLQKAILKTAKEISAMGGRLSIKDLCTMHLNECPLHERRQRGLVSKLLQENEIRHTRTTTKPATKPATKKTDKPAIKPDAELNKAELKKEFEAGVKSFGAMFEGLKKTLPKPIAELQSSEIDVDRFLYDKARSGNLKAFALLARVIGK